MVKYVHVICFSMNPFNPIQYNEVSYGNSVNHLNNLTAGTHGKTEFTSSDYFPVKTQKRDLIIEFDHLK